MYFALPCFHLTKLLLLVSNNRIMTFQNKISTTALVNVQSYLARYTASQTEDYVRLALLYYGEVPFLYWVFEPTNVHSSKEKGGYKVVSVSFSLACTPLIFP